MAGTTITRTGLLTAVDSVGRTSYRISRCKPTAYVHAEESKQTGDEAAVIGPVVVVQCCLTKSQTFVSWTCLLQLLIKIFTLPLCAFAWLRRYSSVNFWKKSIFFFCIFLRDIVSKIKLCNLTCELLKLTKLWLFERRDDQRHCYRNSKL